MCIIREKFLKIPGITWKLKHSVTESMGHCKCSSMRKVYSYKRLHLKKSKKKKEVSGKWPNDESQGLGERGTRKTLSQSQK